MSCTLHTCRYTEGKEEGREKGVKGERRERGSEEGALGMNVYTHVCMCVLGSCLILLHFAVSKKFGGSDPFFHVILHVQIQKHRAESCSMACETTARLL